MKRLVCLAGLALWAVACGPDPLPFERARPQALVQAPGDQIHPHVAGPRLVWFDLGDDPNGHCYLPQSGPDWDDSCTGVVRGMDLTSGAVRTLSEPLIGETRPHISGDQVLWRCTQDGQPGMCITPFSHSQVRFVANLGWSRYYYDADDRVLAIGDGYLVWAQYTTRDWMPIYRLVWADVESGLEAELAVLDQMPSEVVTDGDQVIWSTVGWTDQGYRYRIEAFDLATRERSLIREDALPRSGLAAAGDLLAWQETDPDGRVHVFARDRAGAGTRVESEAAQVSSLAPLALAGRRVLWFDHRDGDYRIAAADLDTHTEDWVTPAEAVVGVSMPPAVSDELVVWTDLRGGDWDLYLLRF